MRGFSVLLLIVILLWAAPLALADDLIRPLAFYFNDQLMIPLRESVEHFSAAITWDSSAGVAQVNGKYVMGMMLGTTMYVPATEVAKLVAADYIWVDEFQEGLIEKNQRKLHLKPMAPPNIPKAPQVYLTFDDGPNESIPEALFILDLFDIPATFFLVGENVLYHPAHGRAIVQKGHQIANHSFSHPFLTQLDSRDVLKELELTQIVFREILNAHTNLFRPPYGDFNSEVREIAEIVGLKTVLWSINPRDYANPGVDKIVEIIIEEIHPGANILLHSKSSTNDALPAIIAAIWEQGYRFAPLPN